jgi:hypothetical protein
MTLSWECKKPCSNVIALVHDYLREAGGAEQFSKPCTTYPDAPVHVGFVDEVLVDTRADLRLEHRETWISCLLDTEAILTISNFCAQSFASLDLGV